MQTIFSYARLIAGGMAVFYGASKIALVSTNIAAGNTDDYTWGIVAGGGGMALALHETAYICARFMRGDYESTEKKE